MFEQEPPSKLRIVAFFLFFACLMGGVVYVALEVAKRLLEGK